MEVEQRFKWKVLTEVRVPWGNEWGEQSLCHFCKYAEWFGSDPCDYCTELRCAHTYSDDYDAEHCDSVWGGDDCGEFQPNTAWDLAVQYTSQRLQGEWPVYPMHYVEME